MNRHREPDDAPGLIDGKLERAKDAALGPHSGDPSVADLVGEAAGGISGVLAGAAIGSLAGPIGTVIGGIAGAVGGWWGGRAISEAVEKLTEDDDTYYRQHYQRGATAGRRKADHGYDDARPAYHLGHIAGLNPEYRGRHFEEIEGDLQRGWNDDVRTRYGEWDAVRGYVEEGFNHTGSFQVVAAGATDPGSEDTESKTGNKPAPGPDEGAGRRTANRPAPQRDRSRDDSDASTGRSIPRGTDETPRP